MPTSIGHRRFLGLTAPRPTRLARGLLIATWGLLAATAWAQEQRIVQDVEVRGLKTVPLSSVLSALRIQKQSPFSQAVADEDIKRLFALGKFDDIQIALSPVPGGIKVIYQLTESAVVKKVVLEGNRHIKDRTIRPDLHLKEGEVLRPHLLRLDEDIIAEKYRNSGYANVEVRSGVTEDGSVVTFHIQENPKVAVAKIVFRGNTIKSRKLLKQMKTRRRRFPAFFFPGRYDPDKVKADVFAVQEYYRGQGWLNAVTAEETQYNPERDRITLTIHVREGQRYKVESVTISGVTIFPMAEIRGLLQLRKRQPFLAQAMQDDIATLRELYGTQGYIESTVERQVIHSADAPEVAVKFQIDEGIRYYVEKVKIGGMDRIQDRIIRRELTLHPANRFDTSLVNDSVRRLKNTGFFDMTSQDAVAIDYEPGSQPDRKSLLLAVKEGKVGDISFGVGASSNTGLFGDITLTHRNFDLFDLPKDAKDFFTGNAFVGAGHILSLRARPGFQRKDYMISFTNPRVYDSPYSFGTSVFYRTRLWDDYDERRIGGTLSVGKRLTRDLVVRLTTKYENINISSVDNDAPQDAKDVKGGHNRLGLELSMDYDKRDSRFLPSKGHLLSASIEGTTADVEVVRTEVRGSKYFTMWNLRGWGKHILSLRTRAGAIAPYGSDGVPIFERFFVGGTGSMRGFDSRGVGPVDSRTKDQVGGKYLGTASLEYSVPVAKNIVRLHTFLDGGSTENSFVDVISDARLAWGVGLELRFPMFQFVPVTMDFGFPLIKKSYDDTTVFTFSIGSGFSF